MPDEVGDGRGGTFQPIGEFCWHDDTILVERIIFARHVIERANSYRIALALHGFGHAMGLEHPADTRALSVMVKGLRRAGMPSYPLDYGYHDRQSLQATYGEPKKTSA
jgi:hypothetical protein